MKTCSKTKRKLRDDSKSKKKKKTKLSLSLQLSFEESVHIKMHEIGKVATETETAKTRLLEQLGVSPK
jgi:peroxiredoxin